MNEETILLVRVVPRAGRTAIAGWRGEALVVRLAAAPVHGDANEALTTFLAGCLDHPRRRISIVSGGRSRTKRVRIEGLRAADLHRRLPPREPPQHGRPSTNTALDG